MPSPQFRYFIATIPVDLWAPSIKPEMKYVKGQKEVGASGYEHWQVMFVFREKLTLLRAKRIIAIEAVHLEPTRSVAAEEYVWKEDTRVAGSQFELGVKPHKRNSKADWEEVWKKAKEGQVEEIQADIRIQHYRTIRTIRADYSRPEPMERVCFVFWGATGTGKSRRAWEEATFDAYPKDPRTKWWDGYQGQENVVIDEFRGAIDIAHMLRWLDRYPVLVEIKGASIPLKAKKIWITSNLPVDQWYLDADPETRAALNRRLRVTRF